MIRLWYELRRPWWIYKHRFQVARTAENPWKHGGRRGKKRPEIAQFKFPKRRREYAALVREGWRPCYATGLGKLLRMIP